MTRDLTTEADIEVARHDFLRAELQGDAALAAWAREYGDEACRSLRKLRDRAEGDYEEDLL